MFSPEDMPIRYEAPTSLIQDREEDDFTCVVGSPADLHCKTVVDDHFDQNCNVDDLERKDDLRELFHEECCIDEEQIGEEFSEEWTEQIQALCEDETDSEANVVE